MNFRNAFEGTRYLCSFRKKPHFVVTRKFCHTMFRIHITSAYIEKGVSREIAQEERKAPPGIHEEVLYRHGWWRKKDEQVGYGEKGTVAVEARVRNICSRPLHSSSCSTPSPIPYLQFTIAVAALQHFTAAATAFPVVMPCAMTCFPLCWLVQTSLAPTLHALIATLTFAHTRTALLSLHSLTNRLPVIATVPSIRLHGLPLPRAFLNGSRTPSIPWMTRRAAERSARREMIAGLRTPPAMSTSLP